MRMWQNRDILPIQPKRVYGAKDVVQAFTYLQNSQHIGKVVIEMPGKPEMSETVLPSRGIPQISFSSDHSYFLVGGLRGMGGPIATFMDENGVPHLTLLSRSPGETAGGKSIFKELEAR